MNAGRATAIVMALALGSLAVGSLAACGAPSRVRTVEDEPGALRALSSACAAIDPEVRAQLPAPAAGRVLTLELNDAQCKWLEAPGAAPQLIVGTLERAHGGTALDETTSVLTGEQSIGGIGERAVFDAQTRTLYTQEHGRLWYVQLVGPAPGARRIVGSLARALVQTPAAR